MSIEYPDFSIFFNYQLIENIWSYLGKKSSFLTQKLFSAEAPRCEGGVLLFKDEESSLSPIFSTVFVENPVDYHFELDFEKGVRIFSTGKRLRRIENCSSLLYFSSNSFQKVSVSEGGNS